MEVAPKLILLFRDSEGFGAAIYDALQPATDSLLQRSEEKFELSLEQYGIKGQKACGNIANFIDNNDLLQVSLLLLDCYEPPILPCVVSEVLGLIRGNGSSSTMILTLPCILPASKLKCEDKNSFINKKKSSLYGMVLGPVTDLTRGIVSTAEKPSLSLQIHYEPVACLLEFVQCLNFPTALLIGKRGVGGDHEVLGEVGVHLASAFKLCCLKGRIKLNIAETTKAEEPWRALYG